MQNNRNSDLRPCVKPRFSLAIPTKSLQVFNQQSSMGPLKPFEKSMLLLKILKNFEGKIQQQRANEPKRRLEFMEQQNLLMQRIQEQQKKSKTIEQGSNSMGIMNGLPSVPFSSSRKAQQALAAFTNSNSSLEYT